MLSKQYIKIQKGACDNKGPSGTRMNLSPQGDRVTVFKCAIGVHVLST